MSVRRRNNNSRARSWLFTINNPTTSRANIETSVTKHQHFRYLVYQSEEGDKGTPHWQGYIEFKAPMRFNAVKLLLGGRAHIETRRGTRTEARNYCMKEDSRIAGPWEHGDWNQEPGKRSDLSEAADMLKTGSSMKQLAETMPAVFCRYFKGLKELQQMLTPARTGPVKVSLLYGVTGAGKTRAAMGLPNVFKKDGSDMWFDGYAGEEVLLIDDFAGSRSRITLSFMLNLMDQYPVRLPVKGSFTRLQANHIVVTSNIHPRLWYDYSNREEHYKALKRRFTEVVYYPPSCVDQTQNTMYFVDMDSFFDDWAEGCDESSRFKRLELSTEEEESSCAPTQVMSSVDTIDEYYGHQCGSEEIQCVDCGLFESECVCYEDVTKP